MDALAIEIAPGAHFGDLSGSIDDAVTRGLESGKQGIAIAAPPRLTLGVNSRCPLNGIRVVSLAELARAPLYTAVVVCSCVETGEVLTCAAAPPPDGFPYDDPDEPPEGLTGQTFGLDLFEAPGIPRKQATWVVRVVLRDLVSNAVTIRLEPPRNRYVDPAAEELIRELMRKPILRPLNPRPSLGPGLPTYETLPETPPVPGAPGIALKIKRALLLQPGMQPLLIHGSFRAAILPRDVRPPPTADAARLRGPRATAVVPMALVVLSSARAGADILQLVVPSYQPLEGEGEPRIGTGAFAFDYFQLSGTRPQPQTLFFYAVAGSMMSPVAPCAMVDPNAVNFG